MCVFCYLTALQEEESGNSFHGIAYVDMAPLLYPGGGFLSNNDL